MSPVADSTKTFFQQFGSMVNFVMLCLTLISTIAGGSVIWANTQRDITANAEKIAENSKRDESRWNDHNELHRERSNEAVAERARLDERIKALEKPVSEMAYRMANAEAAVRDFVTTSNKTEEKINQLVTDVAIIKDQLVGRQQPAQRSLTR